MSYIHVQDRAGATALATDLEGVRRFALDCEAAGFHRYSDRLCLVQVTTPAATYVVDPTTVDAGAVLRGPTEDPDVEVVMHGADYDLRLLDRDLGVQLAGLFDTQIAAAMLGEAALGLAALLESRLGVKLSKKYQRADWAQRPLEGDMLEYAASDTRHLLELSDILRGELERAGRSSWAEEEARALEATVRALRDEPEPEPEDPVVRVKGARDLPPREVHALRVALDWRDEIARARDRAPFRVVGDAQLLEAVRRRPRDRRELRSIKGFPRGLARDDGDGLLARLAAVDEVPEERLVGYPRPRRRGPGRPPPEVEERAERLKAVRNRIAERLELDRGTLLPNALLTTIAWEQPRDAGALAAIDGIRAWQVAAAGDALLGVLRETA